mmetsp:Transcript_40969/g.46552  ORF Transcript_40969/g.46552 Transcript_40969/m.46552 type:complete len:277 (-) Transcript_40969:125-955(-)|eukprot:CAMPEP_0194146196 /NCGR_PEP_ID=MMETSP0152-20130528/20296_1 /TAXON_ID=1049557 /ORGANISM="Thalassiothrix antarctica, Strain L6-D1" /LENGTH=276 /DNA_ID=CAMNT_0038846671 /DNA_START=103 /DNA_END=933 /DNA_ORIENTATION=+
MNYGMDYQGGGVVGGGFGSSPPSSMGNVAAAPVRKSYDEQTLIPVTIHMILSSVASPDGGSITLEDGRPLHHIRFVAAVRVFENQSTNVTYQLEDGTGLVEAKQWLDDNDCSAIVEMKDAAAKDAQYIRIIGQVKDYDGKKSVVAHSIRKIEKGDELTHHFLEVVYSGEKAKQASRIGPAPPMIGIGAVGDTHSTYSSSTPLMNSNSGGSNGGIKEQVLNYIKVEGEKLDEGANVKKCLGILSNYTEQDIRIAIEDLAAEGHIYSTINEDHYKFAM